ncbi:MAG TPA: alpha-L-arabinofuranosidase C-terminal domain-containing protein [Verrucomicrobiae bacterium]|nr:alpha-L-arabinofuranosidase C-terminal domain-containing protein [Verrucomicrobiae bacterium]
MTCAGSLAANTAVINIDATQKGPQINPRMYGIFLENLNHAVDGGLYAELIENRGFEDAKPPEGYIYHDGRWVDSLGARAYDAGFERFGYFTNGLPFWSLVKDGGAQGSMNLDMSDPLTPESPRSCRLEIDNAASGRLGIANHGYWGIGVAPGEKFELSFWARCADGFNGALTATLEDDAGDAISKPISVTGVTTGWKQFKATLTGVKNDSNARFVLATSAKGTVWFDMISLFPAKTFKDRPNGLRKDIAQMIADLKPGFVRFPGGCVIEGGTIATAYNWKNTIGPLQNRTEIWGPWNYRETYGMGFFETLQFCEDLGAEPLYVGFAGETCMFRNVEDVPLPEMGWVETNFLDAIQYANGDASTKWGKLRAEAGHSKPFDLKMVEVGNEGGTRGFPPRYHLVHALLKENYPDLTYVNDLSFLPRRWIPGETSDMEDNHFYNSPQWFMNNVHLYDHRDRKLPPVYDGEVAVTSGEGGPDKGNLIAALGEGAFLTGLERNADVVKMVSYAPLLANVSGRTDWHGMIYFDSTRVFGTVSYYLWKLFGENRPDYTVQTETTLHPDKAPAITGAIGVGTWNTSAEFKDIRVEQDGKPLYASDFSTNISGWREDGGTWSISGDAYRQSDDAVGLSYFGDEHWHDYTMTLKARKLHGSEGFLIVFGHKGDDKYWWNVGGWGNREHAVEFNQNTIGEHASGSVEPNRWYDIKVEVHDRNIRCFLDGTLVHEMVAPTADRFFAQAGRDETSGDLIIKAINVSPDPMNTTINVSGLGSFGPRALATVLASSHLTDNNSLDNPSNVAPVTNNFSIAGSNFVHDFPANSLTVLRLKTR